MSEPNQTEASTFEPRPFLAMAPKGVDCTAAGQKFNPRKRGGAAYPKRSGMSRRKLRAKQLAPPITQERTNALLNAALKVWSLKHGFND